VDSTFASFVSSAEHGRGQRSTLSRPLFTFD
jgi:hypothetical protein